MADFNALEALINAHIKKNGVQAITGNILNGILRGMVSALGKGYTIAGSASPSTDPGTMTGPLAYIAYTAGTYTHFGGLEVEQGEVAMLIYNEAEWHKEVLFSLSATATIDGNVGTPEVGVSFVDGLLTFDFRNMKGNPGNDGDAAGFGTISATVDGNIGTPGVSVQTSGPDTAKNMTFQFTNLKGETGVTSVVATVDNTIGTPSCAVSLVGQELHLDFSGLKGNKGDTGVSADYPITIYNGLDSTATDQALSAYQGKVLNDEISQLDLKVDEIDEALDVETTSEVVTERIEQGWNNGYVNQYGSIGLNFPEAMHSDPIFLKAGEVLTVNGVTRTWAARFASYNPDTGTYSVIQMGTSANNDAESVYESSYTANADIYIVVSWSYSIVPVTVTKTYTKVTTTSTLDAISKIESILDIESSSEEITENVTFNSTDSKALFGYEGRVCGQATYSAYSQSDPVFFNKGDKITVVTKNAAANVAVVAYQEGPEDNPFYRSLVAGNASEQTATFIVPFGTYFVFSYVKAQGITVTREYTRNETDSARIKNLENNLGQIPVLSGQVTDLDGKVTLVQNAIGSSVDDDMTEDIVEGKYINNNGVIGDSESFAYKEFVVRSGAVVKLVCSGHSNCASLAKKVSETQYQVLVPGSSSSSVDVTYTVMEDMTMAVSFRLGFTRNIKIAIDYIEANRQNIKRLVDYNNDANIQDIDLGFLFDKIAVIGDSMSVGSIDGFPFSLGSAWLSFLAKRYGCTGKHFYAKGGTTTYGWLNDNTGYGLGSFLADETIYNCYFIAYGHNDSMSVGEITDTVAPVTITDGVPSCPSGYSFCSYYKAVIEQVRAKAPHAMIFCLSSYDDVMVTKDAFRQAIKGIADQYYNGGDELVHYLDTGGVADAELNNGGHYSTIGYAYIAKKINAELNKVIYEHRGDDALKFFGAYNL